MKKEVRDIIVQYIIESLNPAHGVSKEAINILENLLKEDREFAQDLHYVMESLATANKNWYLYPNNWQNHGEINKEFLDVYKEKNPELELVEPYDYGREG